MNIITTIAIGRYTLHVGVATTHEEREAVLAQRFRVYQREGYYREDVAEDRDVYDQQAVFFLATLKRSNPAKDLMVGSARLIQGREDPGFEFPCQKAHRFELPPVIQGAPSAQREEVGRLVSEMPRGFGVGHLVTTLGLLQAMGAYREKAGEEAALRCGVATIKRRLLRGLRSMGLPLHEIPSAGVIYPPDGPVAGYFHGHPDPAVPVYWLTAEMVPAVRHVLARYRRGAVAMRMGKILGRSRRTGPPPTRRPSLRNPRSPVA